jgi:peroxiredoxin
MGGRDSAEAMQEFVDEYGLTFPQAVSEDGSLWTRFGVAYQPAWVFVNDDGQAHVVPNALPEPELRGALDELIAT